MRPDSIWSNHVQLVIATEEQKRSRDRLTHAAWGQRLSVEEFCRRELRLRAHPWCTSGMTTWLWVDSRGAVLASCETFRMRSFLRGAESVSFGVASVYTEPVLRGHGHASAMMRALGDELRRREPGAHGVILFSEVGASLYERAGFVARPCFDRMVPASAGTGLRDVRWIHERELEPALAAFPLPRADFVIWPEAVQIDWHLERARIYAETMGRTQPPTCGVVVGKARALWAADYKNERLAVLLASAPDAASGAALVEAAAHAAASAGLREVRIWETPSLPLPPGLGRREPRDDDALPMLLPIASGLKAEAWSDIPRALWI